MKSALILLFAAVALCAAAQDTNLLYRLEAIPPFPELRDAAIAGGIPFEGMISANNTGSLAPGDSVTALITLHQNGNRRTQWLVYFEVVAKSNRAASRPAKPVVLYNSMGDKFEFPPSPVTFRIRTLGPYVDSRSIWGTPVPKDNYGHASVNGNFLALGLDKSAATICRLHLARQRMHATNFDLRVSETRPSAAEARENQKRAALYHLTSDEKTALVTWFPTLMSYFNAVGDTPGLEGIMWKVVSMPSLWSIVRHAGITAWIEIETDEIRPQTMPSGWDLPSGARAYALPLMVTLNQKPALDTTLIVTDPRPSLLACGGIVGFVAQDPNDEENYVTVRIISAKNGVVEQRHP